MPRSSPTHTQRAFRERTNIRVRMMWRRYVRDTRDWVHNPVAFLLSSYASLFFVIPFAWSLFEHTSLFWTSFYNVLIAGWCGLLLSMVTLAQVKWIKGLLGAPVMGVFLLGASAFAYQDARNQTIGVLNRHFPFTSAQLPEAVDAGSRFVFAIEVAGVAMVLVLAWYGLFMIQSAGFGRRRSGGWSFALGSAGAAVSLFVIGSLSLGATRSFGLDVLLVRSAYEWDFSQAFQCEGVPKDARVLLSKTSDNVGYAVKLRFPERPFLRMRETDKDLAEAMPFIDGKLNPTYRVVNCNRPAS